MEFEPRLVVPSLQSSVVAEDLVNDGQHVVRARAVVCGGICATAARCAYGSVTLQVVALLTRNFIVISLLRITIFQKKLQQFFK